LKYENYYSYQNKQNNSIIFLNKAFEVIEPYFQNNKDRWIDHYSGILIRLGAAYKQKNDYENAIYYILLEVIEPYRGIQKFEIIYNDAIIIFNELKNLINLGGENKEK